MKIKIKKISKSFKKKTIIKDLSFDIDDTGLICLKGESGSGKTTVLNLISGLLKIDEGSIFIDGKEIKDIKNLRKDFITYLPCGNSLIESLTIIENINLVSGISEEEASRLLSKLKVSSSVYYLYPREISTGEYKRVCFARALAMDTPFYLLDEPTSNLDEESAKILIKEITELSKKKGVVVATHDSRLLKKGKSVCLDEK